MRVVHVVESLEIGGAERLVVDLAGLQSKRGHTASIACLFREGPLAARARAVGIDVKNCEKSSGMDLGAVLRLRNWLRMKKPEVLHTHNPAAHYYAVAAEVGLRIGRVINTRHGMGLEGAGGRRELLFRAAMRRTDCAVAVCEAARKSFVDRGSIAKDKAVTIPNGIDLTRFAPENELAKRTLLASLSVPGSPLVFGSVGRLNAVKEQVTMLRAFHKFVQQVPVVGGAPGPAAILVIAGDGELRDALEQERGLLGLDENVFLLGQRDDIPQLLAGFDAFVLSSRSEGYSLALVEAAATGLPIVATDVGGNAEIVQDEATGLLVPPGSPDAMAAAMRRLFDNADERLRMGAAGRLWAQENGSIEAMYERYMTLYQGPSPEPGMIAVGGGRG